MKIGVREHLRRWKNKIFHVKAHPREIIHGGKGDRKPDRVFDPVQLKAGERVEREHSNDPRVRKEIAKDHLTEDKNYYRKLHVMEQNKRFKKVRR